MGDTESPWEGVKWDAGVVVNAGEKKPLTGLEASNTVFVARNTAQYTDETFFFGQINYPASGTAKVQIIR